MNVITNILNYFNSDKNERNIYCQLTDHELNNLINIVKNIDNNIEFRVNLEGMYLYKNEVVKFGADYPLCKIYKYYGDYGINIIYNNGGNYKFETELENNFYSEIKKIIIYHYASLNNFEIEV